MDPVEIFGRILLFSVAGAFCAAWATGDWCTPLVAAGIALVFLAALTDKFVGR